MSPTSLAADRLLDALLQDGADAPGPLDPRVLAETRAAARALYEEPQVVPAPVLHGLAAVVAAWQGNGPLHGLVVAFKWIGIGAVYAIALGTPLVLLIALGWFLARGMRRRREEALLSRA